MISYAQNFEDVMLERVFKQQTMGFYIDIGVWDATLDSVTKHFYDKGWSGINVEPLSDNFQRIATARPRDINLNLAASNHPGPLVFHHVRDTGLSTSRAEYAGRHAEIGLDVAEITVQTKTLKDICSEHAANTVIDFLKIDVEGAEADVINSGDWDAFRPRIVLVEATLPMSPIESFSDWEPVLLEHGYIFAYFDGLNRFYYREEEPKLQEIFYTPPNIFDDFLLYRTVAAEQNVNRLEKEFRHAMHELNEFNKFRKTILGKIMLRLIRITRQS